MNLQTYFIIFFLSDKTENLLSRSVNGNIYWVRPKTLMKSMVKNVKLEGSRFSWNIDIPWNIMEYGGILRNIVEYLNW